MKRGRYTPADKDIIEKRREMVASLRLRGMSTRAIAAALRQRAEFDGLTHETVAADLRKLKAQWREHYTADTGDHATRMLAEYQEAKRQAWKDGDLNALARYHKLEGDLLGVNAPPRAPIDENGETVRQEPVMVLGNVKMSELWPDNPSSSS